MSFLSRIMKGLQRPQAKSGRSTESIFSEFNSGVGEAAELQIATQSVTEEITEQISEEERDQYRQFSVGDAETEEMRPEEFKGEPLMNDFLWEDQS